MANISWDDINNNPAENNADTRQSEYFKLANDGDKARVRLLINDIRDVQLVTVHRVSVQSHKPGANGVRYDRTVSCLRTSNSDPVDACPLCESGLRPSLNVYLQMYNEDTHSIQVWQRGRRFIDDLRVLLAHIKGPIPGTIVEIERHGAKGSKETRYTMYPIESDGKTLADLPVKPVDIFQDGIIAQRSWDECREYVATGDFPAPKKQPVDTRGTPLPQQGYQQQDYGQPSGYGAPNSYGEFKPLPAQGQPYAPQPQQGYQQPQPLAPQPAQPSQPAPQQPQATTYPQAATYPQEAPKPAQAGDSQGSGERPGRRIPRF